MGGKGPVDGHEVAACFGLVRIRKMLKSFFRTARIFGNIDRHAEPTGYGEE